jgi:DNA-binding beta-propeller fold protein YncE
LGSEGEEDGQLIAPHGIAIDSEGDIWVVDTGNNRVQGFDVEGEYQAKFGSLGSGNSQFAEPTGIAVDSEDHAWVVDTANSRFQKWTLP